jgi:hypothetical protein
MGTVHTNEALRRRRGREQALAELERLNLVAVAVRDQEGGPEVRDAGERVEAVSREPPEQTVVPAGDLGQRREGRHQSDAGTRTLRREPERHGAAERLPEARQRAPLALAVVGARALP